MGLEEHVVLQLGEDLGRPLDLVEGDVGVQLPELLLAVHGHGVAEQPAHAVAEQDHLVEGGVGRGRREPEGCSAWPERLAEPGGGDRDRDPGRVHVEQNWYASGSSGRAGGR